MKDVSRIGWREWIALPKLNIHDIKAKIDTGARTSALHAFEVDTFHERGVKKVKFLIHPQQYSKREVVRCVSELVDIRWVSDSGGHREKRCVILTPIVIGKFTWPIEVTLTRRDNMRFRMLLGRTALNGKFLIDASTSYLFGK